jgi:TolB protein
MAFASSRDTYLNSTGDEVFVMNVYVADLETLRQTQLTDSVTWDTDPDWSPDGQHIVWQGVRNDNNEILFMTSDGTEVANLTHNASSDANPAWSPDGNRIAFVSDRTGNEEIYVMDRDGSNVHQLTDNPERDKAPAWSPDSEWLSYQSEHDANCDIFIMRADGSQQIRLTYDLDFDGFPSWQPLISGAAVSGTEPDFDRESLPEFISFRTMSWISEHAVPLLTREPIGFTADLESLLPAIGSSRLVDLSGQGFSTDEDFTLRHRLIEFLIQDMGFDAIVLDITRDPAQLLDRYLNQGEGNPALAIELIDDPRWHNVAFLDLVEWARARNQDPDAGTPIHIYGTASTLPPLDMVAGQTLSSSDTPSESSFRYLEDREQAIAANVRWVIEQIPSDSRMILWGNDFELLETIEQVPGDYTFALAAQSSLGELFEVELLEQPFSIGLALGRGSITGPDPSRPVSIGSAPAGSFEWMATGTGLTTFLLPELSSRDSLLDRRILARAVLSKDSDISFEQVNLAEVYDALIYVDEVRPTRPLIGPESPEREGPAAACDIRSLCFE